MARAMNDGVSVRRQGKGSRNEMSVRKERKTTQLQGERYSDYEMNCAIVGKNAK